MQRVFLAVALLAAAIFAPSADAQVVGGPGIVDETTPLTCDNKPLSFHRHRARVILKHEYRVTYYSTHEVADRDKIDGYQEHKRCIRDRSMRRELGERRHGLARFQRTRIAVTPYAGNGVYWAIPPYVVACESGFDYVPDSGLYWGGAYGLLDSWHIRGGERYASQAHLAPPWAQDLVAYRAWLAGDSWACA